jgi:hypothetical protein
MSIANLPKPAFVHRRVVALFIFGSVLALLLPYSQAQTQAGLFWCFLVYCQPPIKELTLLGNEFLSFITDLAAKK